MMSVTSNCAQLCTVACRCAMSCVSVRRKDGQGRAGATALRTDHDVLLTHGTSDRNAVEAATSLWLKTLRAFRELQTQRHAVGASFGLLVPVAPRERQRGAPVPARGHRCCWRRQ